MKTFAGPAALSLSLLLALPSVRGDDYQGADAILKQVDAQTATPGGTSSKPDLIRQWHADLKSYRDRVASLSADEAAQQWFGLFDRAIALPFLPEEPSYSGYISLRLAEAFKVLPPPSAWDALAARAKAYQPADNLTGPVLQIVTATLQNQPDAIQHGIDALKQGLDRLEGSRRGYYPSDSPQSLEEAFLALSGGKERTLAHFQEKLALLQPDAGPTAQSVERENSRSNTLEVPDLVTLVGPAKAETLLRLVFTAEARGVSVRGEKTKALARKVALGMGSRLKLPAWNLVDDLDSTELYEALDKRFPDNADNASDREQARSFYLLGLIVKGRFDEAAALAGRMGRRNAFGQDDPLSRLPESALTDMAMKGYAKEVFQFFDRLLAAHPQEPYWKGYIVAGVLAGETDAMLARVKAASERTDLKPNVQSELRRAYGEALLAADRVNEALPILRERAAALARTKAPANPDSYGDNPLRDAAQAAATLAGIGQLLGDKALTDEQLDALAAIAKKQPSLTTSVSTPTAGGVTGLFLDAGRGPEMECLLGAALLDSERRLADEIARMGSATNSYWDSEQERPTVAPLQSLVDLYDRTGRFGDIVALLDREKHWGVGDLSKLSLNSCGGPEPLGYQAARALQKTGHADAALRIINHYLENGGGGSDPAYALLLALLPPDQAEARLDALFKNDQFEERPLIWRAVLQLGQGRLDEAEKSARQAIGIDPSDGDEGRGDRLRAYAVLGDILERKGDTEKAGQMRQAIKAIRLSEDADGFHSAGLLTRAVGMYEQALGFFSDAYCIQSRLAIQLTALGKFDEAMTHYERAYELMPESFGRMESHCFGCERAFAGERAQSAAERVFKQLAAKRPDNPRVHYLLGYLRGEQSRNAEAAQEYREAVRLDPDYINAWKQLASATDDPADRDRAELNLLRLDPQRKHGAADLSVVSDLRALWAAVEAIVKAAPTTATGEVYPLAASKAFLAEEHRQHPPKTVNGPDDGISIPASRYNDERLEPWSAVLKNNVITQALSFLPRNDGGN